MESVRINVKIYIYSQNILVDIVVPKSVQVSSYETILYVYWNWQLSK